MQCWHYVVSGGNGLFPDSRFFAESDYHAMDMGLIGGFVVPNEGSMTEVDFAKFIFFHDAPEDAYGEALADRVC